MRMSKNVGEIATWIWSWLAKTTEESGASGLYVYGLDVNVKFPNLSTDPRQPGFRLYASQPMIISAGEKITAQTSLFAYVPNNCSVTIAPWRDLSVRRLEITKIIVPPMYQGELTVERTDNGPQPMAI